jgi:hypothetical protein
MKVRSTLERRVQALESQLTPAESHTKRWAIYIVGSPSDYAPTERTSAPYAEVVWTPPPAISAKKRL